MARRKKTTPVAERITAARAEIDALTAKLREKKLTLAQLQREQAEETQRQILTAFASSGKDAGEVIEWLQRNNSEIPETDEAPGYYANPEPYEAHETRGMF